MYSEALGREVRTIDRLIGQYAESHRNTVNVTIHWICVPIIVWCVLAFLWTVHPWVSVAGMVAAFGYYLTLSPKMALAMAAFGAICFAIMPFVPYPGWTALALFVITWILQFYGHHVEGKKPSFLDDLRFLLIGPVFLLAKLFRKLGLSY